MEEDLYKLFNSYINNLDSNINITELLSICLKYSRNYYLRKISIQKKEILMGPLSSYSVNDKTILVYINNIISQFNNKVYCDSSVDTYELFYYTIFHSLLHEIEHSKQTYLLQKGKTNTLEKELLSATMLNINEKSIKKVIIWKEIYSNFYDYMLLERLADYKAYRIMNNVFKGKDEYVKLKYFSLYKMKETLHNGYRLRDNNILSPTITVINKLQNRNFYSSNDKYSNLTNNQLYSIFNSYDLKTRYMYGLPITTCEYNYLENDLNNTREILDKKYKIKKFKQM